MDQSNSMDKEASSIGQTAPAYPSQLSYQLEFLKLEFDCLIKTVDRLDMIRQSVKNWAFLVWAGSLSVFVSQQDLRQYTAITAFLPPMFWLVEMFWTRIQRRATYRVERISEFLNGHSLAETFSNRRLVGFRVLDPRASQYRKDDAYRNFTAPRRVLFFWEICSFYLGLMALSLIFGVLAVLWVVL